MLRQSLNKGGIMTKKRDIIQFVDLSEEQESVLKDLLAKEFAHLAPKDRSSDKQYTYTDLKKELNKDDIKQISEILGHRCRKDTKAKIKKRLKDFAGSVPVYGVVNRLICEKGRWQYCAGQSYPDEIRTLRKIFLTEYK